MVQEDKRRSYTDTLEWKKRQQSTIDSFEFSPSSAGRGNIQAGPSSFLNLENISLPTSETEEIQYAMFPMHPSSRTTNSQQHYVNTQINTKPTSRKVEGINRLRIFSFVP